MATSEERSLEGGVVVFVLPVEAESVIGALEVVSVCDSGVVDDEGEPTSMKLTYMYR